MENAVNAKKNKIGGRLVMISIPAGAVFASSNRLGYAIATFMLFLLLDSMYEVQCGILEQLKRK